MSNMPPPPPPNMAPPPGYVAYGGGTGLAGGNFRRVGGLGKALVILLGVTIAAQALLVIVQLSLRNAAKDFLLDGNSSKFDDKLVTYVGVGALVALAGVAQLVLLCIWTFRMAKNTQLLGRMPQKFSPGATIAINILGGCTLGILPYFMWREIWQGSDPDVAAGDPNWRSGIVTALIPVHLALTLCGVGASLAMGVGGLSPVRANGSRSDIAKNISDKLAFVGVSGALTVVAAVVFLMLVKQLTDRHARAIREV